MKYKISPRTIYLIFTGITSLLFALVFTISSIYYIENINLTPLQLVLVGTTLEVAYFIFEIPTGIIGDVYSRRLSIIIGTVLIGFAFILEGSFPLYLSVLISQILWGTGASFLSGATEAWVADFLEENLLEKTYIRASQVGQVCSLLGIGVSVALATVSIQLPIVLSGILFIILAVLLLLFMPESTFAPLLESELKTWKKMIKTFTFSIRTVKKNHFLRIIFLITLISGLASEGFDRLWIVHFIENYTFPKIVNFPLVVWIGIINSIGIVISIILSQVIIKKIINNDDFKSTKALFFLNLFHIIAIFLFARAGSFSIALISLCSINMLRTVNRPIYSALIVKNVQPNIRSSVLSSEGQLNSIGQIIGGPIIGIMASKLSISAGIVATSIILFPSIFLYLKILRKYKRDVVPT